MKRCRYKASVDENLSDRELIRLIKKQNVSAKNNRKPLQDSFGAQRRIIIFASMLPAGRWMDTK